MAISVGVERVAWMVSSDAMEGGGDGKGVSLLGGGGVCSWDVGASETGLGDAAGSTAGSSTTCVPSSQREPIVENRAS